MQNIVLKQKCNLISGMENSVKSLWSSLRQGWGFYAACALLLQMQCPSKSQKCPTLVYVTRIKLNKGNTNRRLLFDI